MSGKVDITVVRIHAKAGPFIRGTNRIPVMSKKPSPRILAWIRVDRRLEPACLNKQVAEIIPTDD
jgi:hypothetical protein